MEKKKTLGLVTVTGSYVLWGLLPGFWTLLAAVNPVYVLAQRILWSLVFMGLYLAATRSLGEVKAALTNRTIFWKSLVSGVLITLNWGVYIVAVNSGHVLDASMGYFIEPVIVALIGLIAFREKPTRGEWITFFFAVGGILYLLVSTGKFPALPLIIAAPFAVYGGVKKNLNLTAQTSLFMETLLMMPFALGFSWWWSAHVGGWDHVMNGTAFWLLPACGLVTSIPLLLFNMGVKEIPYYFSGILMYINPTLQFLMGLVLGEPMDAKRLIAFAIIWVGVFFTLADKVRLIRAEARRG